MSELRKAGECFSLAGKYSTAAEVYAKGNLFNECLASCTNGRCFDLGLQYIEQWKQQASQNIGIIANFEDVDKIAQKFLETNALECHRKKDYTSLMKFVWAFNSMESKRKFLKSFDCLNELLALEEESGNFHEAADIANHLGDTLREVDLLEKAGDYANATSLIILYVIANSLWAPGNQGWPIKSFPSKEELLSKAVSIALKVSENFHSLVSASVNAITSSEKERNLAEVMRCYHSASQCSSRTATILTVRKVLDTHLQVHPTKYEWNLESSTDTSLFEGILKNQASCKTLVHIWNLWKGNVLEILDCLDSVAGPHLDRCLETVEFCYNYFGVRPAPNVNGSCALLKPNAAWVANVVERSFIVTNRKVAVLDARHFASAAQKYWHQELVSTGLKVLESLQALYKISTTKLLSKFCQCSSLTCIYEVSRFLVESNYLDVKKGDGRRLQEFLQLSTKYVDVVFPLDTRQSLSENLISFREAEICKDLLGEVITRNICTAYGPTHAQFGQVVMIILASGMPRRELFEKVIKRFSSSPCWKLFMASLEMIMGSHSSGSETVCLEFHQALEESFQARWSVKDCISPNCFVYLVERLLILVPRPNNFFFTTKSSLVEHILCLQPGPKPCASSSADKKFYSRNVLQFLLWLVQSCLYNVRETQDWIKKSRIDCRYYLPVLMLRLIVILCSLCLNSDLSFDTLFEMLHAPHIASHLPPGFCQALLRKRRNDGSHVAFIASAFKRIDDPLVILSFGGGRPRITCPDAIFLDTSSFSSKNEILEVLFPKSNVVPDKRPVGDEKILMESSGGVIPSLESATTEPELKNDIRSSSENEKGNVQIKPGHNREMSDAVESLKNRSGDGKLESLLPNKKVDIQEYSKFLTSALSSARSCSSEKNENEELNAIYSSLDTSGETASKFVELLKITGVRIPHLSTSSPLSVQDEPSNASLASQGMGDEETCEGDLLVTEDNKTTRLSSDVGKKHGKEGKGLSKKDAGKKHGNEGKGKNKRSGKSKGKRKK